jgi:hypothetical protein
VVAAAIAAVAAAAAAAGAVMAIAVARAAIAASAELRREASPQRAADQLRVGNAAVAATAVAAAAAAAAAAAVAAVAAVRAAGPPPTELRREATSQRAADQLTLSTLSFRPYYPKRSALDRCGDADHMRLLGNHKVAKPKSSDRSKCIRSGYKKGFILAGSRLIISLKTRTL